MRRIDYETDYNALLQQNVKEVRDTIHTAQMQTKIRNYAAKYDVPARFVQRKIMTDPIFAFQFAKEPGRQSYHQSKALEFIADSPHITDAQQLPSSGKNALFVIAGTLVKKENLAQDKDVKSIDFAWNVVTQNGTELLFYASHKYTKDEGGAQDNQYEDLRAFMRNARLSADPNIYFIAIGDGPFYQRKIAGSSFTRIELMNQEYRTNNCVALTTDEIDDFIEELYTTK